MIYNGMYGATTAGSCANARSEANAANNIAFNYAYTSIVSVGYTFDNDYETTTENTTYGLLFGTNENYSGNTTDSTIKDYLENTWFHGNMDSYKSKLESSAGYCNDRAIYISGKLMDDEDFISAPYSGTAYYGFGPMRNLDLSPTLNCARNMADLYTTTSATDGNKQLSKPTALLTADEVSFAGSRNKTYLISGSIFRLLSPRYRYSNGFAYLFVLTDNGFGSYNTAVGTGVRPVVSLMHYIQVTSGSGTAISPWTIE